MKILLINGPNINMLGTREPGIYGSTDLASITQKLVKQAESANVSLECFQSNAEHEIIEKIQNIQFAPVDFLLINPAAFTHTSVAIRDAIASVAIPFIEIHLSNPHAREPFRSHSYFSDLAQGIIAGFGEDSYLMALDVAIKKIKNFKNN